MANARDLSILAQGASTAGILSGGYGGTSLSSVGSAGNVLFTSDGTAWSSTAKIVQGTLQSVSGSTSVAFTNLPSWAKRITVQLYRLSINGTSQILIQLGTGATPTWVTSGYLGSLVSVSGSPVPTLITAGFGIANNPTTTSVFNGSYAISSLTGNDWVCSGVSGRSDTAVGYISGGYVNTAATVTAVRIFMNGTVAFNANSAVNILYE